MELRDKMEESISEPEMVIDDLPNAAWLRAT